MNHKLRSFSLLMVVTAMLVVAGSSLLLAQDDLVSMHSTDLLSDESIAVPTGDEVDTSMWAKEGPYTIGFINWSSANSWTQQVDAELAHEVSLYPEIEEFISLSADGDVNEQINQMEDLISLGVDAILVIPVAVEPLAPAIDLATENGIPVVVFGARSASENNITTLLANQVNFGRVLGDFLMEELDCQGNVIVLNGITGNSTSDDRRQGLLDAIAACPDGGTNVTILA
ncbi:MAG: substrate-binding domain-containing protein, partial [Burkholderiales bacterium]|nr:substrate-binding domain-containing protein [Anaerolineae bacterium]